MRRSREDPAYPRYPRLPVLACLFATQGWPTLVAWLPPGGVFAAARGPASWDSVAGVVGAGVLALAVGRTALTRCDADLRRWYDRNGGRSA